MSRTAVKTIHRPKPKSKPKPRPEPLPLLPQHELTEPYARLLPLGNQDAADVYGAVANEIQRSDVAAGVETLQRMALDETWYDYYQHDFPDFEDPRTWTRLHAVRTLTLLGEAAAPAVEPLLPLLN